MPNESQDAPQYPGVSHITHINKYSRAEHRRIAGRWVRLLMPSEVREFKEGIQRIIDGKNPRKNQRAFLG